MPASHGSANTNPMLYTALVALDDTTLEMVKERKQKMDEFNSGNEIVKEINVILKRKDRSNEPKEPKNPKKVKCDGRTDRPTEGRTDGRKEGRTDGRTNRRTDGPTDGRKNGHTDGRSDRRTDGRTDRQSGL